MPWPAWLANRLGKIPHSGCLHRFCDVGGVHSGKLFPVCSIATTGPATFLTSLPADAFRGFRGPDGNRTHFSRKLFKFIIMARKLRQQSLGPVLDAHPSSRASAFPFPEVRVSAPFFSWWKG